MNNNISDLLYCFTLNSSPKRSSGSDGEVGLWFQTSSQLAPTSPKEGPIRDPSDSLWRKFVLPELFFVAFK
jgi:hypothetical protein